MAIAGQSILLNANAPNFGSMYVMLDEFHHRLRPSLSGDAIAERLRDDFRDEIHDGLINVFGAPPVEGLGTAGGFKIVIEDRGDLGLENLQSITDEAIARINDPASGNPAYLRNLFTSFRANTPWLFLDIDRAKLSTMGVSMREVFNTLQVYLGSLYVNDFNQFGRTWQVNVQGDANFRKQIEDLKQLKIRSERGGMVPLAALAGIRDVTGPVLIARYNMYPAAAINGVPAPGVSSGQAIERMEQVDEADPSRSDAVRVDRAGALAAPDGQHRDARVRARGGPGVPRPGGAVRELVAAAGGDPGRADVPALLGRRRGRRRRWISTSSRRSASSCWSAWRARTRS